MAQFGPKTKSRVNYQDQGDQERNKKIRWILLALDMKVSNQKGSVSL